MKTITTLSILLLSTLMAYGQDSKLSLGVAGSADFYNFDFSTVEGNPATFDTDLNYSIGASVRYQLDDKFGLNLKVLYATRDFTLNHNFRFIEPNDPVLSELPRSTSAELSYLDLPISVNYGFLEKSNFDFFFSAGLAPGFLIADDESTTFEDDSQEDTERLTFNINSFLISGFLGAGVKYHLLDKLAIVLEPQYRYFFNRVSEQNEDGTPQLFSVAFGAEIKF